MFALFFLSQTIAQNSIGIGVMGTFNFPLKTLGGGLRLQIPITNRLAVIPMGNYNNGIVKEAFAGIQAQYYLLNSMSGGSSFRKIYDPQKPSVYLFGAVNYNKWINFSPSLSRAKSSNVLPILGIGTSFGLSKIRLFAEAKYNPVFSESFADFGLLFYPKLGGGSKGTKCPPNIK